MPRHAAPVRLNQRWDIVSSTRCAQRTTLARHPPHATARSPVRNSTERLPAQRSYACGVEIGNPPAELGAPTARARGPSRGSGCWRCTRSNPLMRRFGCLQPLGRLAFSSEWPFAVPSRACRRVSRGPQDALSSSCQPGGRVRPGCRPTSAGLGFPLDSDAPMRAYRRLAAIDPPVLRSLIVELTRLSDESAASAVREGTAEAANRADRNAQRVAAARAALASTEVSY
jgi:hypothetical protein